MNTHIQDMLKAIEELALRISDPIKCRKCNKIIFQGMSLTPITVCNNCKESSMSEHPTSFYRYVNCNDSIGLEEYELIKKTPRGSWIKPKGLYVPAGKKPKWVKFVLDNSNRKFAWPVIEEARNSFLKRKNRQKALLQAQLDIVESILTDTSINIWPEKPGDWTLSTLFNRDF